MNQNQSPQFEVRDLRTVKWTWSPVEILCCPFVTSSDFKVYSGLSLFANNHTQEAWPSIPTLSARINLGENTVRRSLRRLYAMRLIKMERRTNAPNLYTLLEVPKVIQNPDTVLKSAKPMNSKINKDEFINFFYEACQKTRGLKPVLSKKDFVRLAEVMKSDTLGQNELEQVALYFLACPEFAKFTPSLAVMFSGGILTGLMNTLLNDKALFNKRMEDYVGSLRKKDVVVELNNKNNLADMVKQLAFKLSI